MEATLVRDIMTSDVVTISPEASILDVSKIFAQKRFNGLPVVDAEKHLVGLITQYNIIAAESLLHLPTLEKMQQNPSATPQDMTELADQIKKTMALKVKDLMEKEPIVFSYDDTFEQALEVLHQHHRINPIPVVDKEKHVIGVVSRYDLLRLLKLFGHT